MRENFVSTFETAVDAISLDRIRNELALALLEHGKTDHLKSVLSNRLPDQAVAKRQKENAAIRSLVPRWHYAMLNDNGRNDAFAKAIQNLDLAGRDVLDIGAGSGVLSVIAARAGAARVFACEAIRPIAAVAQIVIDRHQLSGIVSVLPKYSFDVKIGTDMPRRADILVTETVDCGLVGEGLLRIVQHARDNLLKPDAIILPRRVTIHAALLESNAVHELNYVSQAVGVDVSPFNCFSTLGYFPVRLETWPHRLLGESREVFSFDLAYDKLQDRNTVIHLPVAGRGTAHGVVMWFTLELAPGLEVSNRPAAGPSHWMQAVQCFERPIPLQAGDEVALSIAIEDYTHISIELI